MTTDLSQATPPWLLHAADPSEAPPPSRTPRELPPEPRPTPARAADTAPRQGNPVLDIARPARRPPRHGWRRALHTASGGLVNLGESQAESTSRALHTRINQPVRGDHRITVMSLKGGVGKTTVTIATGGTFAARRGDRIIAVDANPDVGTLSQRAPRQTASTIRALLQDDNIRRYSDIRAHTSQMPSRLEILASEQDPAMSEALNARDYGNALDLLRSYYNIILTDCGTGLTPDVTNGVLAATNTLVVVTSPAVDAARSAVATLDWLDEHGHQDLVRDAVVVVNSPSKSARGIPLDRLTEVFLRQVRAVHAIPFDPHLAEGTEIDPDLLRPRTRKAFAELAATIADGFTGESAR